MSLDWTKDVRFTPVNTDEMDGYCPPVKVAATRYILWIFLATAYLVPLMIYRTNAWHSFSLTFVAILLEAMPFMLLGSLIGGVVEVLIPREWISARLAGDRRGVIFLAAALGLVMPVCECAIIPIGRRLLRKGAALPAVLAYLLAGPIVNPVVAASTAVAYGFNLRVLVARMFFGYLIAVCVSFAMARWFPSASALRPDTSSPHGPDTSCSCGHQHETGVSCPGFWARTGFVLRHGANDFLDAGRYLVFGAFAAALLQTLIARSTFLALAEAHGFSILSMMGLAFSLNLCSEADAFVAASFRTILPFSAQLAFMLLGPMLDVKLVLLYSLFLRRRAIFALSLAIALLVFLFSMGVGMI